MELRALEQEDFTIWVPYTGKVKVLIRYLSPEEARKIAKAATSFEYKKHQKVESIDDEKLLSLVVHAAVKDWSGFTLKGEDFPFSTENLDHLINKLTGFTKFVNETCSDLQALVELEEEQAAKKSGRTSGQEETSQG